PGRVHRPAVRGILHPGARLEHRGRVQLAVAGQQPGRLGRRFARLSEKPANRRTALTDTETATLSGWTGLTATRRGSVCAAAIPRGKMRAWNVQHLKSLNPSWTGPPSSNRHWSTTPRHPDSRNAWPHATT